MCKECDEPTLEELKEGAKEYAEMCKGELADAHTHIRVLRQEKQALGISLGLATQDKHRRDIWVGIAVVFLLSAYLILVWEVL